MVLLGAMTSCMHKSQLQASPIVSFKAQVIPIFKTSCAINSACHLGNANRGVNFDSADAYASILKRELVSVSHPTSSLLYVQVATGIMPLSPYPKLSNDQQLLILRWIEQGAQNN